MRALLAIFSVLALSCGDATPEVPPATTSLVVHVTDGPGGAPLPAKLLLYGSAGLIRIGKLDFTFNGQEFFQDRGFCELADGAVGTWFGIALVRGDAELPVGSGGCAPGPAIPYGHYRARVLRGAEFEPFEADLDLSAQRGRVVLDAPLVRAFDTESALAADLHVHAEHSGDSSVPRRIRLIAEAAAGIQVVGSSDHNYNGNFQTEIDALGVAPLVAALPGNEVSIEIGHFNLLPVTVDEAQARAGAIAAAGMSANTFFAAAHALPEHPLIQVNHARLGYAAYFDIARWDGTSWPPPMPTAFDALEVLSGFQAYRLPTDPRIDRAVTDFYTLTQHGVFVAGLGNSDSHHLNAILAGFPKSWVFVRDPRTMPFDQAGFLDALQARHVVATTGPWLDVRARGTGGAVGVGDLVTASGGVDLELHVRQASFVHATRVRVWVGTELRETLAIPPGARAFDWTGRETIGTSDTWIGVDATGDDPLPEELVGDYLSSHGLGGMVPFALISPILVDANGDGRVTLARPQATLPVDLLPPAVIPGAERGPYDCGEPERR
ncbi:MAG TPA: CehA/McbA family metallohydrolase [Polyangia bacterium]|nr:CehA/McbA family metallohydrolase [Polyangia bacterium]